MDAFGQLTASELKARGWTETMIRRFLGPPCATARNPHYRSARPMRIYAVARVDVAERSPGFREAESRARLASARSRTAHETKVKAVVSAAWGIPVALPDVTDSALKANARERLALSSSRQYLLPIGIDDMVAACAVQLLLDACEPALWALDEMFATRGVRAARVIVRKRILSMIAARHPSLRAQCMRRFQAETGEVEADAGISRLRDPGPPV